MEFGHDDIDLVHIMMLERDVPDVTGETEDADVSE
jgi:hypothetical protein